MIMLTFIDSMPPAVVLWMTAVATGLLAAPQARGQVPPRKVDRPAAYGGTVVFSPDHKVLAIGEEDFSLRLVDFDSGATTGFFKGHTGLVSAVAFSPDGRRVATGGWMDRTVRIWDLKTRRQISRTDVPRCSTLAFSPDGRTLASGHADRELIGLMFWDVNPDGSLRMAKVTDLRPIFHRPQPPKLLRYSPDGRRVAFGTDAIHVLDVSRGEVKRFENKGRKDVTLYAYVFFDDKGWLVSADYLGELWVWNVADGTEVFHLRNPLTRVTSMVRVPGTDTVLTGTEWNTVTAFDLKARSVAGQPLHPALPTRLNHFKNLILSDDGLGLAVLADQEVYLFDVKGLLPR